jgi:serine kinase of HPr protein (carbohydrate metabolism regulator)
MHASSIAHVLNAEIITCQDLADDLEIISAFGSDMMSDVIAFVKERVALLTGLTNPQVIRIAELMDIRLIIFVRGKKPSSEMIQMAKEQSIMLMSTQDSMFTACGKLYQAGIRGDIAYQAR